MKVSVEYAAEHFEDLVSAVHNGEAVEIACAGQPALQLVRSGQFKSNLNAGKRVLGAGTALTHLPSEEELERIDREWKREIEDKVIGSPAE
jgi:antitoxin (DNA-binding transcriptional repressor) of toxin-antitoxin stability system